MRKNYKSHHASESDGSIAASSSLTEEQAFLRLAELCARSEHCQQEMLDKMQRWGMDDTAQTAVLDRLVKERYIDDERFCRAFVRDKITYNKWGRRKVEQALWQKGIADELRRRVLDEVPVADYVAVLRPLLQQKQRTTRAASDYERRQKLIRWALSRGFGFDVIRQCIDTDDDESEFLDEAF